MKRLKNILVTVACCMLLLICFIGFNSHTTSYDCGSTVFQVNKQVRQHQTDIAGNMPDYEKCIIQLSGSQINHNTIANVDEGVKYLLKYYEANRNLGKCQEMKKYMRGK